MGKGPEHDALTPQETYEGSSILPGWRDWLTRVLQAGSRESEVSEVSGTDDSEGQDSRHGTPMWPGPG